MANESEKKRLEWENIGKKAEALRALDTKQLIEMLPVYENKLEYALKEENEFRNTNIGFLSSSGDCAEVKRILAELTVKGPPVTEKKMTVAERDAWLVLQRKANQELVTAINRQQTVVFGLENIRISIEMAKKRLENVHKILALRTAQIQFLTETR